MRDGRAFRGDVNVILSRLVRQGVIVGFATNFAQAQPPQHPVEITVLAGSAIDHKAVRATVLRELERFSDQVRVTVKAG